MTRWGEYRLEWLIVAAGLLAFVILASFFLTDKKAAKESEEVTSTDNISEKEQEEYVVKKGHSEERYARLKKEEFHTPKIIQQPSKDMTIKEQPEQGTETLKQEDINKNVPEENIVVERYETLVYLGGLTVRHVFEERSNKTSHKAFLEAYPGISVSETITVSVRQIKKELSKYTRGETNNIEAEMLFSLNKELNKLFENGQIRKLPAPDSRIVVGVKMVSEDNGSRHLYFGFNNGQWFPISDEFLVKIIHSYKD